MSTDNDHDDYFYNQDNRLGHDHYDIQYDDYLDRDDNEKSALVAVGPGRNKCQTNLDTTLNYDVVVTMWRRRSRW